MPGTMNFAEGRLGGVGGGGGLEALDHEVVVEVV
jgi:hypothetical protein